MKTPLILFLVIFAITPGKNACAQAPADPVTPLVQQYDASTAKLAKRRKAGLAADAKRYLEALDAVAKLAEQGGSTLVIRAIEEERATVREAGKLAKDPKADLPRQVHSARRKYVSSEARVTKFLGTQEEAARERFIRGLETAERQAKSRKNEAVLARIAAERAKLAGGPDTDAGFGKNLLRNADFTAGNTGPGTPPEWDNHDGGASVELEDGKAFVHITGKAISQLVQLPEGTKRIRVDLRLRAPDFEALELPGAHNAGVHLYLEDAAGKLIASDDIEITRAERRWKLMNHDTKVPDGVSQLRLMLFREGIAGALSASGVSLQALER